LLITASICVQIVLLATSHWLFEPYNRTLLTVAHAVIVTLLLAWLAVHKRWIRHDRTVALALSGVFAVLYSVGLARGATELGYVPVKAELAFLALSMFLAMICPYRGWVPPLLALFCVTVHAVAIGNIPGGLRIAFILMPGVAFATVVQSVIRTVVESSALLEFRTKLAMAPAYIVKRAAAASSDVATLFKPQRRECVCISLGWGDYETLALELPSDMLHLALKEHYQLCDRLIAECIWDGAYYCDVVLDEIFLVVFEPEGRPRGTALLSAFTFARRFVTERSVAAARLSRLDVGICRGEALIGIMGPAGYRKTTGIGELPGRSHRVKSIAGLLAAKRGRADRIVTDQRTVAELAEPDLQSLAIAEHETVRDLEDREVKFWEAKAA
jgi:hypothetical protein